MKTASTKPRPIDLAADEVLALLRDGATTVRRPIRFRKEYRHGRLIPDGPEHHMVWRVGGRWQDADEGLRCPFKLGAEMWGREAFWAKHDVDGDDYSSWSCGPCLDIGPEFHPGIQYVADPGSQRPPNGVTPLAIAKPGEWWEGPPDDWDGTSNYRGRGVWEFNPWVSGYYSGFGSVGMPRWASRFPRLVVVSLDAARDDDGWAWVIGIADRGREG